ncbi:MAG: hypothetical protein HYS08_03000 [Chlamydiae bacterium]|nr:hypothetical protein [Chlamydiota bacterium]
MIIIISSLRGLFANDFDDLSVYRASSYMSLSPKDPLLINLREHLEAHRDQLGEYRYQRYKLRLGTANNYLAQNWLIQLFEKFPLKSPYQSVFFANLFLHLLAGVSLFYVFGRLFLQEEWIVKSSFLLSSSPVLFFFLGSLMYYVHTGWMFFPFNDNGVLWYENPSRSIALTFFYAALLLWMKLRDPSVSLFINVVGASALTVASVLSHLSMGLLLIGASVLVCIFWYLSEFKVENLLRRFTFLRFSLFINGLIILTAFLKFLFLSINGITELHILKPGGSYTLKQFVGNSLILLCWCIATNLLSYLWLNLRQCQTTKDNSVLKTGDRLFLYFLPVAIMSIGLNVFHPSKDVGYFHSLVVTEGSLRIVGLAHVLWWMVLGIWLSSKYALYRRALPIVVSITLLFVCVAMGLQTFSRCNDPKIISRIFNKDELAIRSDLLLTKPATEVYKNEALYFQAIANQLRSRKYFGGGY